MPRPPLRHLYQRALLWAATGFGPDGQPVVAVTSTEIACRVVGSKAELMTPDGNTITLDAKAKVAMDIPIGSQLWVPPVGTPITPGATTAAWNALVSGGPVDVELYEVKTFNATYDMNARIQSREVGLFRFKAQR